MSLIKSIITYTATALCLVAIVGLESYAAGPADEGAINRAWQMYQDKKFAASADAFDALIKTATPSAKLYYYAATANKSCNRTARASQLSQYVIANFPASAEAGYARSLFPAGATTSGGGQELPENMRTKTLEELLQTAEGRAALKAALRKHESGAVSATGKRGADDHPFTEEVIAGDGVDGITQFGRYPNCWFECSMDALASVPRGQRLIANMLKSAEGQGSCTVRFPGDTIDYTITPQKMETCKVHDKALWATMIHCAAVLKFHGIYSGSVEDGLHCLTGKQVETLHPANTTEQAVSSFISTALALQNPVVCESPGDFGNVAELVEPMHAFAITGFDSGSGMITFKNPHGENSRRFRLKPEDPDHAKFEQLNDGIFKMHVSLVPKYFNLIARAAL